MEMKLNAALELPEADVGEQMLQRGLIVDIRHDVPTKSQPTWTVFFPCDRSCCDTAFLI
jgi:hypothetical protein